jgi:hypothetical protein
MTNPKDPSVQAEPHDPKEPVEDGKGNSSPGELTLDDLSVKFEPDRLGDHLPVFGTPDEIIRINRDHPEYLDARRTDDTGSSISTDTCTGKTGKP